MVQPLPVRLQCLPHLIHVCCAPVEGMLESIGEDRRPVPSCGRSRAYRPLQTIVLLRGGRIVQKGTLQQMLGAPADEFVTRFIQAQRAPFEAMEQQP